MTKRYGVVLAFNPGVTRAEAETLAAQLYQAGKVEGNIVYPEKPNGRTDFNAGKIGPPIVHEYNDAVGGPVWFIP